tara:strand:- start:3 stop:191 length:189 start_codon:yes stop_codon:yes gene_type:complete
MIGSRIKTAVCHRFSNPFRTSNKQPFIKAIARQQVATAKRCTQIRHALADSAFDCADRQPAA